MKKTAIITDSTASIKPGEINGVYILPLQVIVDGEESFRDGIEIDYDHVHKLLKENPHGLNISTSLPRQSDLLKIFEEIKTKYDRFIFLPLSKGLSGTYDMLVQLAKELSEQNKDKEFLVFETSDIAISLKWLVEDIKALVDKGCDNQTIKAKVESHKQNILSAVTLKNLVQMRKGGRISGLKKFITTLLRVKPIILFDKGVNTLGAKVFSFSQAVEKIFGFVKTKFGDNYKIKRIGFCYSFCKNYANEIKKIITDFIEHNKINFQNEIENAFITSVIIVHTGIDAFSISLLIDNK
ncbi:DegV family protein [Mycoplasmoides genitalium]|uniref:DegV family protein n=1 Tax=Mycoplasmoides genitalium TaxID=2097 RepID=UPI00027B4198|nr:DegV family protein [Mycoplasmoides genitalium]AFQ03163.1 degV family protein [Mycoplasmoides genitalium M2321]